MASVMCSKSELKWGLHNKGHHRPSVIPVPWRFEHDWYTWWAPVLNQSSDTLYMNLNQKPELGTLFIYTALFTAEITMFQI